jgi:hypothetical protein
MKGCRERDRDRERREKEAKREGLEERRPVFILHTTPDYGTLYILCGFKRGASGPSGSSQCPVERK